MRLYINRLNSCDSIVDKMIGSNFNIGCRDFFTIRMLKNNGINKCSMVGCPAWYDLNSVNKLNVNKKIGEVKKICISDPWRYSSYYQVVELVELLRNRFSKSKIYLIYHRGNTLNECGTECFNEIQILEEKLKRYNVESVNISGSAEKLDIYDDCIDRLIKTDYFEIEKAFFILNKYYRMMEKHICSLKNRL